VYRYRFYDADGDELGEATYAVLIEPGEEIVTGDGRKLRVLDVAPVQEEGAAIVGLLKVESCLGP
jgi:hypothetical protein